MDPTKAGLIGALGGGALGAAGAWVAALIAFRGSRYQTDAQIKSTHAQWLRQIRRDTYDKYMAVGTEAQSHWERMVKLRLDPLTAPSTLSPLTDGVDGIQERLLAALAGVELEAPPEVRQIAMDHYMMLVSTLRAAKDWPSDAPPTEEEKEETLARVIGCSDATRQLLDACRETLQAQVSP
ncbi:hypothetical protein ACFYWN_43270 [Streptomyces sp. NPDC002917]|uniref:hypothetical protein n=1 Tax=Streptomyces sp. NPDC002917 TaxID=3364671 RepID=UPI0036D1C262